ncbi:MAG TPA: urease accessory UreF family protein [Nitrososphaeraceae archaeon]|nr:urease accessory UreF family protein [Nitrososphaeraceae archaeon]
MDTKIDSEDISILQISDSFFPTGLYATSSGLEALSQLKKLKGKDITEFIATYLKQVIGPSDCTALGNAYQSCRRRDMTSLLHTDESLYSLKLIDETRTASVRSGNQLLKCVDTFAKNKKMLKRYQTAISKGNATGVYPVSFGVVTESLDIEKKKAGVIFLYGFVVSIIGAALRLGILQHFEGQKVIHYLKPVILQSVLENIEKPISSMWQFAPRLDILQMKHENMSSKMFIT